MRYISTRGGAEELSFEDVLLKGLATDGGLYVPKVWPQISLTELEGFVGLDYQEIAYRVMKPFIDKTFSSGDFRNMINVAYSSFNHDDVCPLKELSDSHFLLELFHGPTLAFKDVAMQLIGQMFDQLLKNGNSRITVIAATSGDTGSAAMAAFKNSSYADVFILFPEGRISEVQRRQMTTMDRSNIYPIAVAGDFDDCQALVKAMFNDSQFKDKVNLTGVNSINWARVMCQITYFFYAATALGAPKETVSFSVPTGNFGDIFAGYVAKRMGLPIDRLVIATNENDILNRALETGIYRKEHLMKTMSPSMDIQVASNFERILFESLDRRGEKVNELFDKLNIDGGFVLDSETLKRLRVDFSSCSVSEERTAVTINSVLKSHGRLVCPHTAVGISAAQKFSRIGTKMITLATAHPAKFPEAAKIASNIIPPLPKNYEDIYLKKETLIQSTKNLADVKEIISERIDR